MRGDPFIFTLLDDPTRFLQYIVIIVVSICLHELGHGFAAIYLGDDTPIRSGHMTWNPIVHMGVPSLIFLIMTGMAWGSMPVTPSRFRSSYGNAIVSAAGPFTNFALAISCAFVVNLLLLLSRTAIVVGLANFFWLAAYINIILGLFNLIPVPPLDGFQVFKRFIPELGSIEGTPYGFVALYILFFTGAASGLSLVAAAVVRFLVNA
ncbi:MAG: site-2 protease family protein [Cyanobacteria bacterium J06597_1]